VKYTPPMHGGAAHPPSRPARCVLWHPRGEAIPPELEAALRKPSLDVVPCDHDFAALAHLCAPRPAGEAAVLLLVEPTLLRGAVDVVTLAERHAPDVVLWVFESSAIPQIRAGTAADLAPAPRPPTPPQVPKPPRPPLIDDPISSTTVRLHPGPPNLRLAGDGPLPISGAPPAKERTPSSPAPTEVGDDASPGLLPRRSPSIGNLLTDEELAMLLATDDDKRR